MFKILAFSAVALLLTVNIFGRQSELSIVPKEVTYKRRGADIPDNKKTFTVRYPIIKNRLNPALKRKIENTISYWRVFKTSLREEMKSDWTYSIDYQVNYNDNGVLDITLIIEGSGAYPDSAIKNLVVDLKTGKQLKTEDLFNKAALPKLLSEIRKKIRKQEDEAIKETPELKETLALQRESSPEFHPTPEQINWKHLEELSINYKGVTFLYDYNFPHVTQALEPDGRYFFAYAELKPFIKRDGLLARFIR